MMKSAPTSGQNPAPPDFLSVFEALPDPYLLLLPNDPIFTILAVNCAFEKVARTGADQILGLGISAVFHPDRNNQSARDMVSSLQRAVSLRVPETMSVINYDIPSA